ncbi:hypothetical protein ACLB2K_072380 [Fragaria x ananassa]
MFIVESKKTDLKALEDIQNEIASSRGSEADFAKETEPQANLNDSLRLQEKLSGVKNQGCAGYLKGIVTLLFFMLCVVQYFFVNGQLSASFNSGLIILIPKVEHADSIKQFRPIALTNFVFKIIPKIFALRLSSVAAHLISPQQHAFVPDLYNKIEQVHLAPDASMEDTLIWMPSSTRDLTAKHAYQFLRHPSPSMPWGHIRAASRLANGPMHNSVQELRIIKSFGAECRLGRAPRVIEVVWHPLVIGWVKINLDGAWKHAEGVGGFDAVFRDFKGHVLGVFSSNIDIPSSVAAEVMTVIVVIELAWVRD